METLNLDDAERLRIANWYLDEIDNEAAHGFESQYVYTSQRIDAYEGQLKRME